MTTPADHARAIIDSYEIPDIEPVSPEFVSLLNLPGGLPDLMPIADVAEVTGVSAHTLRYYERIGLVAVDRDSGGRRAYDEKSLARILFITRLRMSNMPIADIQRYIMLIALGDSSVAERRALMEAHRESIRTRLKEFQAALAVIEYKIETYGGSPTENKEK